MLDYGNLSFISAQNPYVTLMRSGQAPPQPRPRIDVEFYVYGWSRRILYSSVQDAPPLSEETFRQAFASRAPFWTTITRRGESLDAYVLSALSTYASSDSPRRVNVVQKGALDAKAWRNVSSDNGGASWTEL